MSGLTINYLDGRKTGTQDSPQAAEGLVINRPDEGAGIISDRALYWNEDKSEVLEEDDPNIRFIFCGAGCEIKREDVAKYGLKFEGNRLLPRDYVEPEAPAGEPESPVEKPTGPVAPVGPPKAETELTEPPEDLEAMTVIELRELAKKESVSLTGLTAKADIIAAIQLAREPQS